MSKKSSPNPKDTGQTGNRKKALIIGIVIGIAVAGFVIARIAFFAWPKSGPVTKLKIEDMEVGTGREAKIGDTLTVEYIGWVYGKDRNETFDKSANHENPFQFVLGKGEAIEGWDKGLIGMKEGGQRKLTIPSQMAYGSKGALNGKIPPDSALVFEVELLQVSIPLPELPPTSIKDLKLEDKVVGTGAEAKAGSTLTVHYAGWLEDGSQFDSSRDYGEPIEFVLGHGEVIAGWEQGIRGMKTGGIRKLTIPPALAYGEKGFVNYVPPNATLIYEVELLAVK